MSLHNQFNKCFFEIDIMHRRTVRRISFVAVAALGINVSLIGSCLAVEAPEEVLMAVIEMQKTLAASDFAKFYRDQCDPYIHEQVAEDEFVRNMQAEEGKRVTALFDDVVKAINEKAGVETLMGRFNPDDETEYEFAHVKRRQKHPVTPPPWHIELKLRDGKWRLTDYD